jgi:hypothetical protein
MKKAVVIIIAAIISLSCSSVIVKQKKYYKNSNITTSVYSNLDEVGKKQTIYFLPRTKLAIDVKIVRTVHEPGYFKDYAKSLLGIKKVVRKYEAKYEIKDVVVNEINYADESKIYAINSVRDSIQTLINLNNQSILSSLNKVDKRDINLVAPYLCSNIGNKSIDYKIDYDKISPFKEMMKMSSTSEKAIFAANIIYKIRKKKMDYLTREGEELPADGKSYAQIFKELNDMEAKYKLLFTGTTITDTLTYRYYFEPTYDQLADSLFLFNPEEGVVNKRTSQKTKAFAIKVESKNLAPNDEPEILNGVYYKQGFASDVKFKLGYTTVDECKVIFPQLNKTNVMHFKNGDISEIEFNPKKGTLKSVKYKK